MTLAQATTYISDSSMIAIPSASKSGPANISLICNSISSVENVPFEYFLDMNYGMFFMNSNIAGSSLVLNFTHTFSLELLNRSTIQFTFPGQFVFNMNSKLSCSISGIGYSGTISDGKLSLTTNQSFSEFSVMHCVG